MAIEAPEKPTTATPDTDPARSQFAGSVNTQQTGATRRNIPGSRPLTQFSTTHA